MNNVGYVKGFLNTLAEKREGIKNPTCSSDEPDFSAPKYFNKLDRINAAKPTCTAHLVYVKII